MQQILEVLFWILMGIVIYTYVGYAVVLYLLLFFKRLFFKKKENNKIDETNLPEVTLLICAYNEEDVIAEKMKNTLAINYPKDKFKIVWATDGSNDRTNELLAQYKEVTVLFRPERKGKTAALNRAIEFIKTPIVIFTDANTYINSEAVREIATCFEEKKVGCVAGEKRIEVRSEDGIAAGGEGFYWKYESALKRWDGELYSAMGAAGELFAIRTELFEKMSEDTLLDDFILSLRIVQRGYKIAYCDKAYAIENGSANLEEEKKRKIRISAGGLQSIWRLRSLMNIFKYGVISFQFISHRVLRWSITPFALMGLIPTNVLLVLMNTGDLYLIIWLLQVLFYTAASIGYYQSANNKRAGLFYIPCYFLFMNLNVFGGIKYLIRKERGSGVWEKAKRA